MGGDLDPLAAAGDHRKHRRSGRHHPHIVLQLRHVLLGRRLFRERPGQHEFGLEDRPGGLNPAVQRGRHPPQRRMADLPLDIRKDLAGIGLVPAPIELLGGEAELDDEIAREVFRLDLARFSRQSRRRAASSLPMMIRASEPPMKYLRRGKLGCFQHTGFHIAPPDLYSSACRRSASNLISQVFAYFGLCTFQVFKLFGNQLKITG